MERLTQKTGGTFGLSEGRTAEEAIQRLGHCEEALQLMLDRQALIERELEKLRGEGKQKSGRFKEMVARKLMNQGFLEMFE